MTGSWDRTLKFWDTRSPNPMMQIQLPERAYCVDVKYPMAVCGTAGRGIIIYQLENQPQVTGFRFMIVVVIEDRLALQNRFIGCG